MAILDPRLLPLLETLAETGADWLAFEIVDGVRRGREPEEPEDLLAAVRERVRSGQYVKRLFSAVPPVVEPILGDDQIVWAANYVAARLDGALTDLDIGRSLIETVAEGDVGIFGQSDPRLSKASQAMPIVIALVGEFDVSIDKDSIAAAKDGIAQLKAALTHWSLEARGKPTL